MIITNDPPTQRLLTRTPSVRTASFASAASDYSSDDDVDHVDDAYDDDV